MVDGVYIVGACPICFIKGLKALKKKDIRENRENELMKE